MNHFEFHQYFNVIRKIGKGSSASVYLGERKEDQLQVAIKAFSKEATYAEEQGKESIENEIEILRKLDHPHIIKMYEVYETKNSIYMILELIEGGQLYDLFKQKY